MNISVDDEACAASIPTPATQSTEEAKLNEDEHERQQVVADVVGRLLTLVTQKDV